MTYGVFKSVVHASLHIFPWKEKSRKNLSQISKSEYIEIKSAWKEQNELLNNTSRYLEMELWRFKFYVRRGILCTAHEQGAFSFHFWSVVSYD